MIIIPMVAVTAIEQGCEIMVIVGTVIIAIRKTIIKTIHNDNNRYYEYAVTR